MRATLYSVLFALCCLFTAAQASTAYDDIIREAAIRYGVPFAFVKSVIRQESAFDSNAESPVGAQGLMQLMPATADELGVTDRLDPRDNIMGGTKYLSQLLGRYDGDPVLALAAYNAGMGRVDQYGGVPPYEETVNYITRISGFMAGYGAGSLNLAGLPSSFVSNPTGGGSGAMAALESLPSLASVMAAFESSVGLAPSRIETGISLTLGVIGLIWVSWHIMFIVGMIRDSAITIQGGFFSVVRALVLLTVLIAFISRGGL